MKILGMFCFFMQGNSIQAVFALSKHLSVFNLKNFSPFSFFLVALTAQLNLQ